MFAITGHMWAAHKVKATQNMHIYQCDKCEYATDRKGRFKEHMDSHLDNRT